MATTYRWEIKTRAGSLPADRDLFLTLHGRDANTEPVSLVHRGLSSEFLSSGFIETDEDLGNLVSAEVKPELRITETWDIDFLRVTRIGDTPAIWLAEDVGICSDTGCPLARFEAVSILPEVIREIPVIPEPTFDGASRRIIEMYGQLGDRKTQIKSVLFRAGSKLRLKAGGRILIAESPLEGFGLTRAGRQVDPNRKLIYSIANQSFDVVALDGFTVRRLPSQLLEELFGPSWWKIVIGAEGAQGG